MSVPWEDLANTWRQSGSYSILDEELKKICLHRFFIFKSEVEGKICSLDMSFLIIKMFVSAAFFRIKLDFSTN